MDTRQRIIHTAVGLLEGRPVGAVSIRDICEAADVTAPTLYHHFGDKDGLFDAVAAHGFETYVAAKHALEHTDDPVADLSAAWDAHVEFGVRNPALYTLMYGNIRIRTATPAAIEAHAVLIDLLARVADAGRLRLDIDDATSIVEAACVGITLQSIRDGFDKSITAALRDTVLGSVVTPDEEPGESSSLAATASRLYAHLNTPAVQPTGMRPTELALLKDWLTILADPTGQVGENQPPGSQTTLAGAAASKENAT